MLDLGTLQIGVKVDSATAKSELNSLGSAVETTGSKTQQLASKAKTMIKAFIAAYAIKEIVKLGKAALDAYAQFEQLEGGVQKIFGKEAAETVMRNAEEAYRTAGLSANEYMETVTNFSASLIQSMGGNTEAAAKVADMAIRDMSDNANTFGTNMKSIQDAYQGFAKQNYTMLDNLKLGYGGTKTEMERLLKDAEKLTGKKYNLDNLADVYEAIHVIQEEYNITGTTAKESAKTIEGSVNTMKAAFQNLLIAIGGGKGVEDATTKLLNSMGKVVKNVAPVALNIVKGLVKAMAKAVPKAIGMLGTFMSKLAEGIDKGGKSNLGKAAVKIITTLLTGLIKNVPKLLAGAVHLVVSLAGYLIQSAPQIMKAGAEAVAQFAKGFLNDHPKIKKVVKTIGKVVTTALKPVKKIIEGVTKVWEKLMGKKDKKKLTVDAPFSKAISSIGSVLSKWGDVLKQKATKTYNAVKNGFDTAFSGMKDILGKWKDILGQTAKKTYTIAKSGFETVLSGIKKVYNWWKKVLGMKDKKTFTTKKSGNAPEFGGGGNGGHVGKRIGLREVPYDGYTAELHKGEAVLTAAEVNKMKKNENVSGGGDLTVNVYGSNNMDVNQLAAAVERRIINIQKRRSSAWA